MTEALPLPLTPADADLREFAFMPFDVVRFAQSDIVVQESPEAVLAAILLWGASWHSIPAGSLTDDDRTLANLAGYGRAVEAFRAVKEGALRGFVKCSDGRLYHRTVSEKVCESWAARLHHRHKAHQAAVRQHNKRNEAAPVEPLTFEEWDAAGRPAGVVTRDKGGRSRVTEGLVTQDATDLSRSSHAEIPSKGRDREGTGTGILNEEREGRR